MIEIEPRVIIRRLKPMKPCVIKIRKDLDFLLKGISGVSRHDIAESFLELEVDDYKMWAQPIPLSLFTAVIEGKTIQMLHPSGLSVYPHYILHRGGSFKILLHSKKPILFVLHGTYVLAEARNNPTQQSVTGDTGV